MEPEAYKAKYSEPLGDPAARAGSEDSTAAGGPETSGKPPQLPESSFYTSRRTRRLSDSLPLDLLTQAELLAVIEAAGAGRRDLVTGSGLAAWFEEKDRRLRELEERLAAQEQHTAELERELAGIRGGRSWRIYRALRPVFRALGRLLTLTTSAARRLTRRSR
jgi:uncharacterized coiled-coil protein SlyX